MKCPRIRNFNNIDNLDQELNIITSARISSINTTPAKIRNHKMYQHQFLFSPFDKDNITNITDTSYLQT